MNKNNTTMNTNASAMATTGNNTIVVRTEKEFETVLKNRCPHFIFEGPKAMEISRRLQEAEDKKDAVRGVGLGMGLLCLLAAPFTGGTSLLGMGAVAGGSVGTIVITEAIIIAAITAFASITKDAINAIKEYHIKRLESERLEFIRK